LDESAKAALGQLLVRDDTLSQLAALKQDAKDFGWRQMAREREKRATLEPLHRIAKALLPTLGISQQNLLYYASLANFYTVHDLRNLKADQTYLYLLCYAWVRYRQLSDNLVDAMAYHMKQLEDESSAGAKQSFVAEQVRRQQDTPQVGRLLSLYIDDSVPDPTPFGDVRQRAYKIMPRDTLQTTAQRMSVKPVNKLALHWQAVDGLAERIRRHLRPLYVALDLAGTDPGSPWLAALAWAKDVFAKQQRLSQRPLDECPAATLPKRLRPYLLTFDADGKPTGLHADRYEFWLYRQVRKRFQSGELYLDDSLQHRHFSDELVSLDEKAAVLAQMDIPFLRQPVDAQLDALATELRSQWLAFNRELKQGKLTHLEYDKDTQKLTWRKPKGENQKAREKAFYEQLPFCDVADVFRFVNGQCQFLSALTPLQPRYAKKVADADSLMAVIIAQAMNHGNQVMARTSDIPYHVLESAYQQYLRHATLHAANDCISNAIAALPIFPYYSFDLDALYGAVDGQKFGVERPTVKARHSRKYFRARQGRGRLHAAVQPRAAQRLPDRRARLRGPSRVRHLVSQHVGHRADRDHRRHAQRQQGQLRHPALVRPAFRAALHRPWRSVEGAVLRRRSGAVREVPDPAGRENRPRSHRQREAEPRPDRRHARTEGDDAGHADPQAMHLHRAEPDAARGVRVRQAHPQHLHAALPARSATGAQRAPLTEPHRVLSPATLDHRPGRRQEGIDRAHRHRNRDQQPVRQADRQRGHLLQLGHPLAAADEVRGERQRQGARSPDHQISPAAWRHILLNGHYTFQSDGKMIDLDALVAGLELG
jgi:hypothetical protein